MELQDYVIQNYGRDSWLKLKKALIAISLSPEINSEIKILTRTFENSIQSFFSLLLLNETGNGPNPLLVTMIQEKLSGVKRTVVWIRPGQSTKSIGAGHRLKSGR